MTVERSSQRSGVVIIAVCVGRSSAHDVATKRFQARSWGAQVCTVLAVAQVRTVLTAAQVCTVLTVAEVCTVLAVAQVRTVLTAAQVCTVLTVAQVHSI